MVSSGKSLFMLLVCVCSLDFTYAWGCVAPVFFWLAYFTGHGCSPGPSMLLCVCVGGGREAGEIDFLFDNRVMFHCVNVCNWFLTQYLCCIYAYQTVLKKTHAHTPKTWRSWRRRQRRPRPSPLPPRRWAGATWEVLLGWELLPYSASPRHPPSTLRE